MSSHNKLCKTSTPWKFRVRDFVIAILIVFGLLLSLMFIEARVRISFKQNLSGQLASGNLPQELELSGITMPDFLGASQKYELTIFNRTGQDLHHPIIEVNGVEQLLPKFEDNFPTGAACELFFNHDWSNLKQGWSEPRADGHLFPTTLKFRSDECSGEWTIMIQQ